MTRRNQPAQLIRGRATHRRTEGEYVGVLLESVTLEDWREVVNGAKALAKAGDPQASRWTLGRVEYRRPHEFGLRETY